MEKEDAEEIVPVEGQTLEEQAAAARLQGGGAAGDGTAPAQPVAPGAPVAPAPAPAPAAPAPTTQPAPAVRKNQ